MRAKLLVIGKSTWIRIPRPAIRECGFRDEVEMVVRNGELVVRSAIAPRAGWDAAFAKMRHRGDDSLLDSNAVGKSTEWEDAEWRW